MTSRPRLGVMFRRHRPPEQLVPFARAVEGLGFDELWVVEDCFWSGGMTAAAAALAMTERVTVGFGIAPAVARNPAVTAMEVAGLARMFPGRFTMGFGHGVADWMRQIGALPASQLAALGETVDAVRRLLRGEVVSVDGRHVHLDGVQLVHPPVDVPPVVVGATGPRSVELAGRVADGLMLPEGSSADYVRAARALAGEPGHCAVYVLFAIDDDPDVARAAVAAGVAEFGSAVGDRRLELLTASEVTTPVDDPVSRFAVAGTARDCAAAIAALGAAGATSVVLVPFGDEDEQVRRAAREVVPLLG